MPTILRRNGYRFFWYNNEHEPIHIHVIKGGGEARVILYPEIAFDKVFNLKKQELKEILSIITENYDVLIDKWYESFNQ